MKKRVNFIGGRMVKEPPFNHEVNIAALLEINYNLCNLLTELSHTTKKVDTMRDMIQGMIDGTEKRN